MLKKFKLTSLMVALVGSLLAPAMVLAQPSTSAQTSNPQVAVTSTQPTTTTQTTTPTPSNNSAQQTQNNSSSSQNPSNSGGGDSLTKLPEISCSGGGFGINAIKWFACPFLKIIYRGMYVTFDNLVKPMLDVRPLSFAPDEPLLIIWKAIRDLTNALLVLVFLFIIFGNAASLGIDAYSMKKAVPRLIAAVILIQTSFLLTGLIIDIGNVLGGGIEGLASGVLHQVGAQVAPSSTGWGSAAELGSVILVGGVSAILTSQLALWGYLIPLIVAAGFSVLILLLSIFVRQLMIAILIVLSPLAFAAWVLPNTEKYFRLWWENLFKVVMVYPVIILLFIMGDVVAIVGKASGGFEQILAMFGPLVAFMMMPGAFKWAGSLTANLTSAIRSRVSGYSDRITRPLRENVKEGRKERGFIMATNQDVSAMRRAQGRFIADGVGGLLGGAIGSRQTARRMAAGGRHARHARLEDEKSRLHNMGIENPDYGRLAKAHSGQKVVLRDGRVVEANHETREAAISALGENGGIPELIDIFDNVLNLRDLHTQFRNVSKEITQLEEIRDLPGGPGLSGAQKARLETLQLWMREGGGKTYRHNREVWDFGLGGNRGGVLPNAPHLIHGRGMEAYQDLKGGNLEKLHGNAAKDMMAGAKVSRDGRQKLLQAMAVVGKSSTSITNIAQDTVIEFYKSAINHELDDATVKVGNNIYNGYDFAVRYLRVTNTDAAGNPTAIDIDIVK